MLQTWVDVTGKMTSATRPNSPMDYKMGVLDVQGNHRDMSTQL